MVCGERPPPGPVFYNSSGQLIIIPNREQEIQNAQEENDRYYQCLYDYSKIEAKCEATCAKL